MATAFSIPIEPDWEALLRCIRREGTPDRVHFIELFLDREVQEAIAARFGIWDDIPADDPHADLMRTVALQRFLGYDTVRQGVTGAELDFEKRATGDTAELQRDAGREFVNEHTGPIGSREDFERFPWPTADDLSTDALEWYEANLPDDMCVIGSGGFGHFAEHLIWLFGYESLCFALFEQRALVEAVRDKLIELNSLMIERMLQFDRVRMIWGSDDMGFRSGTLISPDDTRALFLPGHRLMAEKARAAGRLYLLHSCGNLEAIMPDLLDDVKIDGKHSFEDAIEPVTEAKRKYGDRVALLGGVDMDFLCRSDEEAIRRRVREILDVCLPGGGYCLGTGNSVANYIPLDHYLAMLDEGRRYGQ